MKGTILRIDDVVIKGLAEIEWEDGSTGRVLLANLSVVGKWEPN